MADERPAFTLDSGTPTRATLPIAAWALAAAGFGILAGSLAAQSACPANLECYRISGLFLTILAGAGVAGAAAWFALPLRAGGEASARAAAFFAFAGAAGGFAAVIASGSATAGDLSYVVGVVGFAATGLALPCAMLPALRPDATLAPSGKSDRGPTRWLQVGAVPAAVAIGGFGLGALAPLWMFAGPVLLALGGVALLRGASFPPQGPAPPLQGGESRLALLVRMTPMLRHAALAEAAFAFCLGAVAAAIALAPWPAEAWPEAGVAIALGAALGAAVWTIGAPEADAVIGRGALLTGVGLAWGAAPLLVAGSLPALWLLPLLFAAALFTFALSSGPQRAALLFDLTASRARLRIAADIHALKLLAGAAGVVAYALVEAAAPGLGLVAASSIGFVSFASFAPTLGTLGRRTR